MFEAPTLLRARLVSLCTDSAQTDQAEKSAFGLGFDATSKQKETVQDNTQS